MRLFLKKNNQEGLILWMMMLIQFISFLGIYLLLATLIEGKLSNELRHREERTIKIKNKLQDIKNQLKSEWPACVESWIDENELLLKKEEWWTSVACHEEEGELQFFYLLMPGEEERFVKVSLLTLTKSQRILTESVIAIK